MPNIAEALKSVMSVLSHSVVNNKNNNEQVDRTSGTRRG